MADIFVYAPDCEDFDNLGLCGPLTPTSAKFTEEANGTSEITLEQPIDEIGRWDFLRDGYILQAEVPVRTTPEIINGEIVTSYETWTIKSTATKNQRGVYSKASGGKRLTTLKTGAKVTVVDKGDSRYKIKYKKGYGYIAIAAIEYDLKVIGADDPAAIETIVPAWSIRPQLFRIYKPVVKEDGVTVTARHISYDLLGNLTTYTADNPTCIAALNGILDNCAIPHDFVGRTNIDGQRVIQDWTRISPIEALSNPDNGLLAKWGADMVRDNWELTVLADAGINRGVRIEYAKNMTGVECTVDTSDIITAIMPVGQTNKGKPLLLVPGTYTVDGKTITIDSSLTVKSSHAGEYPVPHVFVLDLGTEAKATGTSGSALLAARNKMIKAALDKFQNEKCDIPNLSLKVDFIGLGDTSEYAQYKQLENIYLYDYITVWHPKIGIDVLVKVRRVEYDPVLERFGSIELDTVRQLSKKRLPSWQLPAVIPGTSIAPGSVSSNALADGSVTDEQVAEGAITTMGLADGAVSREKIANAAVGSAEIENAAITRAKIGTAAIGSAQIEDAQITSAKIADAQITNAKIALLAVGTANIQDAAIETAKIKDAAITQAKINTAEINWASIANLAADIANIAKAQITTANIEAANIDWAHIGTLAAEVAEIARAQISSAKIGTAQIDLGAITTALIATGAVDTAQIKDGSITDAKIVNLTASKLTAGTIDASEIEVINLKAANITVGTINGQQIAPGAITAENLANGAITGPKIDFGAITANKLNLTSHVIY